MNGNPSVEPGYLNDDSKVSSLRSALAVPLEGLHGVIGVLLFIVTNATCLPPTTCAFCWR